MMDYGSITMKHLTFGGSENMKKRAQHFQVGKDLRKEKETAINNA